MNAAVAPPHYAGRIIRRARLADLEAIVELAKVIPIIPRWTCADYHAYCAAAKFEDTQAKALFVACIPASATPLDRSSQLICDNVVGFAAFSVIPSAGGGESELENMAVAEPWRRQGIARRLLAAGVLWCRAWGPAAEPGAELWLEVRASNRNAIAFYESAGLVVSASRPRYYTQPEEDAVLMRKPLDSPL